MNEQEERAVSREIDVYEDEAEWLRGVIVVKDEIISELMDQKKPREWVSVDERLPDNTDWVLVFGGGAISCRAWNSGSGKFEDWENGTSNGLTMEEITHWQPLPLPPAKEAMT